jgi:arginyl-tRNA synthetase
MSDPQAWLSERIAVAVQAALGDVAANVDPMVRRSEHADFQANAALGLAKQLKRPPREVARDIIERLELGSACEKVEIAGPGFINLTLSSAYLEQGMNQELTTLRRGGGPRAERAETVVIDYSHPNVAKEMHVGHLRSTIIGDALARVLEYLGHRVIRQNHIGDWGTPFGMLIEHMIDIGEKAAEAELTVGELSAFYQEARKKFDTDPSFADRARSRVVALQGGDEATLHLWRVLVDKSKTYFALVYDRLGTTLSDPDICGESFYNPMLPEIADELERRGIARIDNGALCVFLEQFKGRDDKPFPLIIRKRDGGYPYATTDLAAVRHRTQTLGAERLLYVVAAEQQQHLAMVFEAARRAGWLTEPARAEHATFGMVLGADRKKIKTRSGESTKLIDLLEEAVARAADLVADKAPDLDAETRAKVARQVGIGAVKYGDLSSDRIKDYVFDWQRMLAFDGNTAPYLQYAHARIGSIFRKAGVEPGQDSPAIVLRERQERALALELLAFDSVVHAVAESLQPHRLCGYLYDIATAVMAFYERCPVLKAESEELRRSRLELCELTQRVLRQGLSLLGIEAPERM